MPTFALVTNSYMRPVDLVIRSLDASIKVSDKLQNIFFVDQNPVALELPKAIEQHSKFKKIKTDLKCVSQARNLIKFDDQVDWIIFCDDDGHIDHSYIDVLENLLEKDSSLQIVAGSIVRDDGYGYYSPRHAIGGDLNNFRNLKLLMGSNFCVRRDVFDKLEGFDEDFGAGGFWGSGEETDFAWKAYFENLKMAYCKELIVYHVPPHNLDGLVLNMSKAKRYGVGKGALVAKWLCKGRPIVMLEVAEMYLIPVILSVKSVFLLNLKMIPVYCWTIIGRTEGLLKGIVYYLRSKSS